MNARPSNQGDILKYSTSALRDQIAREERRAARKIKKIASGTYNPRGKRSRLYDIVRLNRAANGEIPPPPSGFPVVYYRGVDISGTERDPRRDSRRLREPGLKKYLEDLKTFNSGLVNYFKAADGSVVTGQEIRSGLKINGYRTEKRIGFRRQRLPVIGEPPVETVNERVLKANRGLRLPWIGDEAHPTGGKTLGRIQEDREVRISDFRTTNVSVRPLNSRGLRERRERQAALIRKEIPEVFQQEKISQFYSLSNRIRDALLAMDPVKFLIAWEGGGEFVDALAENYQESLSNPEDNGLDASESRALNMIKRANQLEVTR